MRMDMLNMEYFITVCQYRNITKAAEILHISQSALSRRIQTLEENLGVELLLRGSHYIELTPAGEHFLAYCEKFIRWKKQLVVDMDQYKDAGHIRIGYSPDVYVQGLLKVVTRLRERYPDIKLRFLANNMFSLIQNMLSGELDIVYTTYGEVADLPHIKSLTLTENDLCVMVPRNHRLWKKNTVKCSDLVGEQLCIDDPDQCSSASKNKVVEWLKENGIDDSHISFLNSFSEVLLFAASGKCLGVTGVYMRGEAVRSPEYVKNIVLSEPHMNLIDLVLAYRDDNQRAVEFMEKVAGIIE